ncbi:MAG: hypothetical protein JO276_09735 [Sphingomonadaceae bacterium]|nr:hypothetical protein [Sphingomonadaceae bacterium]
MTVQAWLWSADGAAFALAVVTGLADRLRQRRTRLDDPGWVPWRGLHFVCMFATLIFLILAVSAWRGG